MSRIAVIGGHGKVALHLSRILSGRGHQVSSLIRNPDHRADVEATGAEPVVADVESLDAGQLAEVLRGHDAVVWSAGAGGGSPGAHVRRRPGRGDRVDGRRRAGRHHAGTSW